MFRVSIGNLEVGKWRGPGFGSVGLLNGSTPVSVLRQYRRAEVLRRVPFAAKVGFCKQVLNTFSIP